MHIIIKNKKLIIDNYKVKCAIGKRGIRVKKKEGDLITPKGKFKIKCIFYRNDRLSNFKSNIKKVIIKKNMGWCDDPNSNDYNRLVKLPSFYSAEKLYRKDNIYDLILILNYNMDPIYKNKGSAIFIHVARKNYKSTAGCVAIKKSHLKNIVAKINKKTVVKIS